MKKILLTLAVFSVFVMTASSTFAAKPEDKGFDEYGYNQTANNFVGTCLSWHMGKFESTEEDAQAYCGVYSNDKLKMSWNEEWNRGNAENWSDENGYEGAWTDNQWNGMKDGSGEVWHYRIKWVGECVSDGTPLESGGYCIWGQFEMLMDHGTMGGEHHWFAHSLPSGYGSY